MLDDFCSHGNRLLGGCGVGFNIAGKLFCEIARLSQSHSELGSQTRGHVSAAYTVCYRDRSVESSEELHERRRNYYCHNDRECPSPKEALRRWTSRMFPRT